MASFGSWIPASQPQELGSARQIGVDGFTKRIHFAVNKRLLGFDRQTRGTTGPLRRRILAKRSPKGRVASELDDGQVGNHLEVTQIPGTDRVAEVEGGRADQQVRKRNRSSGLSCVGVNLRRKLGLTGLDIGRLFSRHPRASQRAPHEECKVVCARHSSAPRPTALQRLLCPEPRPRY